MVKDELMRVIVHHGHEFTALANDGNALAPRKHRREETGNLNILFFLECMWNTDGIICNKSRLIVISCLFVEEYFVVK